MLSCLFLVGYSTTLGTYKTNETLVLRQDPNVSGEHNPYPRVPAAPIYVFYEGNTLTFPSAFIGCEFSLVDVNESLVYFDYVDENGIIEIPNTMEGVYELRLRIDDIIYISNIEL